MKDFRDKVAVITGAGSGIGRALALACAQEGMRLALLDLQQDALEETAALAGQRGALLQVCDVTDEPSVEAAAAQVFQRYGSAHLLFNNAGCFTGGPLWELPSREWRRCLDVNVMGVVHGLRAFIPRLLDQADEAHIVNTASVGGLTSPPHYSAYSASKHAVVALSECLYHDLREVTDRVGVSVLCPAFVKTGIADAPKNGLLSETVAKFLDGTRAQMQKGRLSADDVARFALEGVKQGRFYLLSHPGSRVGVEWRLQAILKDGPPNNPLRQPS